jgi:hypothetical protein
MIHSKIRVLIIHNRDRLLGTALACTEAAVAQRSARFVDPLARRNKQCKSKNKLPLNQIVSLFKIVLWIDGPANWLLADSRKVTKLNSDRNV